MVYTRDQLAEALEQAPLDEILKRELEKRGITPEQFMTLLEETRRFSREELEKIRKCFF